MKVFAIVAYDSNRIIGGDGAIPWRIPEDMKRFAALTTGHTVVMGRKTFESLPPRYRPLPNRRNIVITRRVDFGAPDGVSVFNSPETCLRQLEREGTGTVWIIGGGEIYRATLKDCHEIYATLVSGEHPGDTTFPEFEADFEEVEREQRDGYAFIRYLRREPEGPIKYGRP